MDLDNIEEVYVKQEIETDAQDFQDLDPNPLNSYLEIELNTPSPSGGIFEASFIETDNKILKYKCPMCKRNFKSKEKVESHVSSHITVHSNNNFKCPVCTCYCGNTNEFQLHLETHKKMRGRPRKSKTENDDKIKQFICEICAKGFKTKQQLHTHSFVHQDFKPFSCGICGKAFKLKQQLQIHSKVHEDFKPFICEICNKAFKLKQQLDNHSKTHSDVRPFECLYCDKAFKFKQQLQIHFLVHNDLRPFECEFCGKAFKLKQQLQFHSKVHSDERPFECEICGKGFKLKQQLHIHSKVHTKKLKKLVDGFFEAAVFLKDCVNTDDRKPEVSSDSTSRDSTKLSGFCEISDSGQSAGDSVKEICSTSETSQFVCKLED